MRKEADLKAIPVPLCTENRTAHDFNAAVYMTADYQANIVRQNRNGDAKSIRSKYFTLLFQEIFRTRLVQKA